MTISRLLPAALLGLLLSSSAYAGPLVPFKGSWEGMTTSADPSQFPLVWVVTDGVGHITHLGRATMTTPHWNDVFTGEIWGEQIFTAANGDVLIAWCEGWSYPQEDESVDGLLDCYFASGTGRFANVSGSYTFTLQAVPRADGGDGYETVARIEGEISFGNSK